MTESDLPSSATPPKRRAVEVRDLIMDSLEALLWERPLRDITVQAIMERTDLSRPSFYIHFKSVPALLADVLTAYETVMVEAVTPWLTQPDNGIEGLRVALGRIVDVAVENGAVFRACAEAATVDSDLAKAWDDFMDRWDGAVSARIQASQESGSALATIDPKMTAIALNRMNAAVLIRSFGQRPQGDPARVLDTMVHVWHRTIYASAD